MKINHPKEAFSHSCFTTSAAYKCILQDLIEHISASYPHIWALAGLYFNDDDNYQLASYFKSRYTIYYQHGSNSFGGVCLAIAREVPHRIASEFHDVNNLIAADVFNSNKKYTMAVVYSPPSEEVPINVLNRLHRYNRNLILIGDLNARHPNWHDVTSNSCGHRLAEWIDEKQNMKSFNSAKNLKIFSLFSRSPIGQMSPTWFNSISSYPNKSISSHRAFSCLIRLSWNRSENARRRSLSSALAPIIIQFAQQRWIWSEKNRLGGAKLHTQSQTEFLLRSLSTDEASIDRVHSRLRGISCGLTRKMYHLSHDQKLSKSTSLLGEYYQAETQDSLPLSIYSTRSASKFSLFSEQVHSSWNESGQASSMARVLPRTRAEKYATLLEPLEKAFQGKSNSNSRVSRWAKPSSDNQCRCHDRTCLSILLVDFQRKESPLSESRRGRIQETSR